MGDTNIEWADRVWNVVRGCSRVSAGCVNCYAERQAIRQSGPGGNYEGLVRAHPKPDGRREPRWTGEVRFVPEKLHEPLSWRSGRVFVNSMSDLFHEGLAFEHIAAAFGVMAACPRLDFLVLTKRPERARDFMRWIVEQDREDAREGDVTAGLLHANWCALRAEAEHHPKGMGGPLHCGPGVADPAGPWPLPNVWLGVSVEDQRTADERIPLLLETPAALRWVSYEPALGPVDFWQFLSVADSNGELSRPRVNEDGAPALGWIVVGGESGPGARPFDVWWARSTIEQGREAGVPVFVKQMGARVVAPVTDPEATNYGERLPLRLRDRKGGDPSEWWESVRVREYPEVRRG